jgi:hypothetical protein
VPQDVICAHCGQGLIVPDHFTRVVCPKCLGLTQFAGTEDLAAPRPVIPVDQEISADLSGMTTALNIAGFVFALGGMLMLFISPVTGIALILTGIVMFIMGASSPRRSPVPVSSSATYVDENTGKVLPYRAGPRRRAGPATICWQSGRVRILRLDNLNYSGVYHSRISKLRHESFPERDGGVCHCNCIGDSAGAGSLAANQIPMEGIHSRVAAGPRPYLHGSFRDPGSGLWAAW